MEKLNYSMMGAFGFKIMYISNYATTTNLATNKEFNATLPFYDLTAAEAI